MQLDACPVKYVPTFCLHQLNMTNGKQIVNFLQLGESVFSIIASYCEPSIDAVGNIGCCEQAPALMK